MPDPVPPVLIQDIADFRAALKMYAGRYQDPLFKRFRLNNGIYGQRQSGVQMARIKIPYGQLTPAQCRVLADVGDKYSTGMGHITDRQAIQYHFIDLQKIPDLLTDLAAVDLTTREGCGNCVRNITGDELAGIAADEAFDTQPVAEQVFRHFIRNPDNQSLPRKFKIAFSGSSADRAKVGINDFGGLAEIRNGQRGFRLYVGGSLGAIPYASYLLAEWVPSEEVVDYCEAVIRTFDRHGNRSNIYRARLKFLILDIGFENFQKLFDTELANLRANKAREVAPINWKKEEVKDEKQEVNSLFDIASASEELQKFFEMNVVAQKQKGLYAVYLNLRLGNYQTTELRKIAELAEKYSVSPELRTTVRQKILIANVSGKKLAELFIELQQAGLAEAYIDRAGDIVCCPGTDTCLLGIVKTRGLARELQKLFEQKGWLDLSGLDIYINGCPSSCGQHRIAGLGFQGSSISVSGTQLPAFDVLAGGLSAQDQTKFGLPLGRIVARHIPTLTEKLIGVWQTGRSDGENFSDWARRTGAETLKQEIAEFTTVPEDKVTEFKYDFEETTPYKLEISAGECAGMVVSLLDVGIADAERELYLAEQVKDDAKKVGEHLQKAVLLGAKTALIPEGLEPKDTEVWTELEKTLFKDGQLAEKFQGLLAKAKDPANLALVRDFLKAVQKIVDEAKLAIKGSAVKKADAEFNKAPTDAGADPSAVETYDLSGVKCPMNYVKTKLKLEKLPSKAQLDVILDAGEPKENVPLSVKADGHAILGLTEEANGKWRLQIQKK